ncbi:hypothetical protein AB6805_13705 [Chitinophaga sp. RCC_12]|uniref:hypothetical protein n=1 Tax=Chitinophaga sp. RCC_12 TaxID=3239226 RepID=UPI003525EAC4
MKHFIRLLGAAVILSGPTGNAQPGAPTADAKFVPSITGKNSSIGNIYSPNLFDGSANINIPIYQFSNNHGSFGVSFSYNTKGVKVDEIAGKAGLHWTINAGGGISRVMRDLPDELNQVHQLPASPNGTIMTSVGRWGLYNMTSIPGNIQADGENDDFIVSVGGLNFTFKIGKDGYVFTHPNRRVKIEKLLTGELNFKITDESGNQYFFRPGDFNQGRVQNNAATNNTLLSYSYVSRWVIEKIIFAEGNQITYEYDETLTPKTTLYRKSQWQERLTDGAIIYIPSSWVKADQVTGDLVQLKAIRYPNGVTASFVYDTASPGIGQPVCATALKEVVISSGSENCTRFSLSKAYHVASHDPNPAVIVPYTPTCDFNNDTKLRMILTGIEIKSCDGTVTEPYYSFEYSSNKLPSRMSGGMDRFGYNNGAAQGIEDGYSVPQHTFAGASFGVNREVTADVNTMAAANLVKVKNALGGSVSFAYELHSGLQNTRSVSPEDPAFFLGVNDNDGLRIRSITETDKFHPGNSRIQNFIYSGGQRFLTGGYFHYLSDVGGSSSTGNLDKTAYTVGGYSISPRQLINGSNHGYSEVKVESRDQSGNLIGRTEYVFTNIITGTDTCYLKSGSRDYLQEPFTDKQYIKDWLVGLPLKTTQYDQFNHMVTRTTNTYSGTVDMSSSALLQPNVKTMRARTGQSINPFLDVIVATDTFLPYTGKVFLQETLTEKFPDGSPVISDKVSFGYDSRDRQKWIKTRNSKGEYILTEYVYNYDVVEGSGSGPLYDMKNNGIEKVISTERWSLGTSGLNRPEYKRLLDASINGLEYSNGTLRSKKLYTLNNGAPIDYSTYTGILATSPPSYRYNKILSAYSGTEVPSFKKTTEVMLFDEKGNPLEAKLRDLNSYKAMLWDTVTGDKLADVSNARYNEIAYTSFEILSTGATYPAGTFITDGRFTYQNSGLAAGAISGRFSYSLTPTGVNISVSGLTPNKPYIVSFWSKNGIPNFSGAGATVTLAALYATSGWTFYQGKFIPTNNGTMSFSSNSQIFMDEIRLFPADAMMQSWTYKPLCGATSTTDAAGRIIYLEYDKLGRPVLSRNQEGHILSKTEFFSN